MSRHSFVPLLACVGLSLLSVAAAWGPITHYRMTCGAMFPGTPISECTTDPANAQLMVGSDIPDAFFFGNFITYSSCTRSATLHNLVFAGYQVHLAQELINNGTVPPNAEFNPLQFALGFGAHVAGDGAGFYPGGYLGNGHVTPGLVNWVSLWQFMTTVDSHMLKNYSIPYQSLPTSALPRQGSSFISQATQYASSKGATFPVLDDSAAYNCTQVWSQVVNRNVRVANAFSRPTTFDDLVFFDNYGATSPLQAVAHLDMAVNCAVKTIAAWVPEVTKSGVTPESAAKTAYGTLEKLVALGACNPPTAEQAAVFRAP